MTPSEAFLHGLFLGSAIVVAGVVVAARLIVHRRDFRPDMGIRPKGVHPDICPWCLRGPCIEAYEHRRLWKWRFGRLQVQLARDVGATWGFGLFVTRFTFMDGRRLGVSLRFACFHLHLRRA